ncbi:MAG: DUF1015 domain-containing protein [Acidimicrobiales bacterium]|nr:DUF1015 domain-containing protein [Acidimicrobiales bacterium]
MPRFEPFPGIRYDVTRVAIEAVTAPPYDVIDDEQRATLARRDPHNIVLVDVPVSDGQSDPYVRAAELFRSWRDAGVLVEDPPTFYGYRMDYKDESAAARHTTGVIGALELSRPGEGGILPHEHTTPKAKSDRLNLLRATATNLSPVWGLSPASGLTDLLAPGEAPIPSWVDDDGVRHSLWPITERERQEAISAAVGAHPVVIADGHHRYETSLAYRDERRQAAGRPREDAPYEAVMTYVVELSAEQLTVLPIHRLIRGLPPGFELREAFAPFFECSPAGRIDPRTVAALMDQLGALTLIERSGAWFMKPKPSAFAGVRDLDTSRLDAVLARVGDHELVFQHGVTNVVASVEKGDAVAGVLLRPASVDQIVAIANGGERMPPKTTFFHPKPRTGVVFRALD